MWCQLIKWKQLTKKQWCQWPDWIKMQHNWCINTMPTRPQMSPVLAFLAMHRISSQTRNLKFHLSSKNFLYWQICMQFSTHQESTSNYWKAILQKRLVWSYHAFSFNFIFCKMPAIFRNLLTDIFEPVLIWNSFLILFIAWQAKLRWTVSSMLA